MLINYVPGEECRVALVEDGRLEELHAESNAAANRVGNIYLGVVANVESAIQAAFVDFGVQQHGFLHVTDLHPQYFPGEDAETTERVGHKTPRRERPLIQKCLKKGQQILVQVLKEGAGTKGPSLTSYLSIPGRHIVMMPKMDRVGVSRRVEDEDVRRQMRKVLDQLDLPEGFGFIIRTAGLDKTKAELKRDLAYLQRLWKDMESRRQTGKGPRLLYTESDLLVRALRDLTSTGFDEIVVDNELALARAAKFRKIVAPRSQTALLHYKGHTPIFHAYGIEEQIINIHSREVPLPSGGRLVIDQTEALVAVDVNSGKSRSARDAETNAYKTNLEAVDEICRQLKLRDLGGVVINDLIDMREGRHRREIESRFRDRLKRDRAKSTILPISNFGILEMTRQRIRSSHETIHFIACSTCRGRGLVQRPDSVAADALRSLAALLDQPKVQRVELVVSPMVASDMLSNRRRHINRLERIAGKHVDVRVSETLPADRTAFYAYDENGADLEIDSLPKPAKKVKADPWTGDPTGQWAIDLQDEFPDADEEIADYETDEDEASDAETSSTSTGSKKKRRRGRRGGKKSSQSTPDTAAADAPADETDAASTNRTADAQDNSDTSTDSSDEHASDKAEGDNDDARPSRSKRRRRGRRKKKSASTQGVDTPGDEQSPESAASDVPSESPTQQPAAQDESANDGADGDDDKPSRSKRRRRGRRRKQSGAAEGTPSEQIGSEDATSDHAPTNEPAESTANPTDARADAQTDTPADKPTQSTSRRRSKKKTSKAAAAPPEAQAAETGEPTSSADDQSPPTRKKRTRRKTSRSAKETSDDAGNANTSTTDDPPAKKKRSRSKKKTTKSTDTTEQSAADAPAKKPARTLYASRRKLSASERARLAQEE
jgi:ribonuclease E